LIMNGSLDIPNIHMGGNGRQGSPFNDRQEALLDAMYRETPLKDRVEEGFAMRHATTDAIRKAIEGDDGKAVSAPGLKGDMRRIAIVMREQFNIGFIDVGGWDTHVNQGSVSGVLANRLDLLGQSL